MVQTRNVAKRQETEECTPLESVMFNDDSLFKIASYFPADCLLNLALTCSRFGVASLPESDGDSSLSLVEETARRIVHDIATEEQMNALPRYDGYNWLSKYNYLQSLQIPLTFDQLVGSIEYVEGNKSRVANNVPDWATAFSNNIMMAGKHYASFEASRSLQRTPHFLVGVMRPGEAMQSAEYPLLPSFFENFTQRKGSLQYINNINCCMYESLDGVAVQVIGEKALKERHGMEWRVFLLLLTQLECYLIWMRGHYQSTITEESWA